MKITHNNILLADDTQYCTNILSRTKGLRFSKPLKEKQAVILASEKESITDSMIDMLFVFFPIDVLWLDKGKQVIDMRKNVRPFTPLIIPKKPAKYVIELKTGTTKNIKIGDRLKF